MFRIRGLKNGYSTVFEIPMESDHWENCIENFGEILRHLQMTEVDEIRIEKIKEENENGWE